MKNTSASSQNYRKWDRWLIIIALFFLCASSYLILNDSMLSGIHGGTTGPPVAKAVRSVNDVRRKFSDDVAYFSLRTQDAIYNRDTIFTGDGSEAELELSNGSRLMINSKSLIVINPDSEADEGGISLRGGSVSGMLGRRAKLVIFSGGKKREITGDGSQVEVKVRESGDAEVFVVSGKARIEDGAHKQELTANQGARIGDSALEIQVKTYAIELLAPERDQLLYVSAPSLVELRWRSSGSSFSSYVVEVSSDAEFKNLVRKEATEGSSLKVTLPADGSTYHWRVTAQSDSAAESIPGKFRLYRESSPELDLPENAQRITYQAKETPEQNAIPVQLQWHVKSPSTRFQVQIASDPKFDAVLQDVTVDAFRLQTPPLKDGKYFWRARAINPLQAAVLWSAPFSFEVVGLSLRAPPKPLSPSSTSRLYFIDEPVQIAFHWEENDLFGKYFFEAARTKSFDPSSIVLREESRKPGIEWKTQEAGTYYWRVKGVTNSGEGTPFSEPIEFNVRQKKPLPPPRLPEEGIDFELEGMSEPEPHTETDLNAKEPFPTSMLWRTYDFLIPSSAAATEFKRYPRLAWSKVENASGYYIQVATDAGFKKVVIERKVSANGFEWLNYKPGYYFWRVKSIDEDGIAWDYSRPSRWRIVISPPVPETEIEENEIVDDEESLNKPITGVNLKWRKTKFTAGYEVEVRDRRTSKAVAMVRANAPETSVDLPGPGAYAWRVRPLDEGGQPIGGFSKQKKLEFQRILAAGDEIEPKTAAESETSDDTDHPKATGWNFQFQIGLSRANLTETSSQATVSTNGASGLPRLGVEGTYNTIAGATPGKWRLGLGFDVEYQFTIDGLKFPLRTMVHAKAEYMIRHGQGKDQGGNPNGIYAVAGLTHERFSQGSIDLNTPLTVIKYVNRTTQVVWARPGIKWVFGMGQKWIDLFGGINYAIMSSSTAENTASYHPKGVGFLARSTLVLSPKYAFSVRGETFSIKDTITIDRQEISFDFGFRF